MKNVYFGGTKQEFNKLLSNSTPDIQLTNATIHYNTKLKEIDGVVHIEYLSLFNDTKNAKLDNNKIICNCGLTAMPL